jgi:hypothetical protein
MIRTPYTDPDPQPQAAPDAVHFLVIEQGIDFEPRLKLECTAAAGAECRMRPADGREEYYLDDPDLVDGGKCWAVEWVEDGGWDTIQCEEGEEFPRIPIEITNDDGPVIHPAAPHPLLPSADQQTATDPELAAIVSRVLREHEPRWASFACTCGARLGDSIDERRHTANMVAREVAAAGRIETKP